MDGDEATALSYIYAGFGSTRHFKGCLSMCKARGSSTEHSEISGHLKYRNDRFAVLVYTCFFSSCDYGALRYCRSFFFTRFFINACVSDAQYRMFSMMQYSYTASYNLCRRRAAHNSSVQPTNVMFQPRAGISGIDGFLLRGNPLRIRCSHKCTVNLNQNHG
ncbi:hypothetical protein CPB84DRAFT_1249229 [Gymnopilus junonius]|uniref:Uncharacterized protein n=1 Tax=Gymnopilus junonius TaxID=109634 RepID=A0A9P5NNE7_GYMJU|nr:hypothetical protein CPB84DRAFT_1249229 [Gymnopilus junonius]